MKTRYKIVTEGKLRDGIDPEQFISAFVQTFKISEEQARKLLAAKQTVTLKDNLDRDSAEKFRRVLSEQIGLEVRVEAKAEQGRASFESMTVEEQTEKPATSDSGRRCPKCGSDRVAGDDCLACGIIISKYLARQAQTDQEAPSIYAPPVSKVLPDKQELDDGEFNLRKVEAGQGWQWIVGGWELFVRNPMAWIAALILLYLMGVVASLIPIIGSYGVNLFSLVFIAGLMLGSREQQSGGDFRVGHIFEGFSVEFGKLLQAGLLYLLGSVLMGLITFGFIAASGLSAFAHHTPGASFDAGSAIGIILIMVLVLLVLAALMGMAFYFVPMLIVFDKRGILESVKLSFTAISKNAIPFLIYGLAALGLGLMAMIPVGLGLIVLAPVMTASMYVAYRDIFHGGS